MKYHWWITLSYAFMFTLVFWREASGRARFTRSAVESSQILDSHIVHFKENVTEKQFQRFAAALVRKTIQNRKFAAEILQQFYSIKCLTARLSNKALKWV